MNGPQNLLAVYNQADALDRREGRSAYRRYHNLMADFADYYGIALNNTVAAFVSLSPNNAWQNNLRSLASVLDGINRRVSMEEIVTSTYNACRDRAYLYATGTRDFGINTKGRKVRSFFQNIMDPTDFKPITIDGHMVSMWYGKPMTMVSANKINFNYTQIARAVRAMALNAEIEPCAMQATLWFTWKRVHNIVYDPQLNLFRTDDQWAIRHRPEDVRPFTKREEMPVNIGVSLLASTQLHLYNGASQENSAQSI